MRGIPKHFNTKQDYEYLINNYSEDVWKPIMQTLYNDRLQFFNRGVLTSEETGITDDTHKVVEEQDKTTGETIRYQYELAVNPDAHMFRVGYTEEEILTLLGSVI